MNFCLVKIAILNISREIPGNFLEFPLPGNEILTGNDQPYSLHSCPFSWFPTAILILKRLKKRRRHEGLLLLLPEESAIKANVTTTTVVDSSFRIQIGRMGRTGK